jgi:hypothetical protein
METSTDPRADLEYHPAAALFPLPAIDSPEFGELVAELGEHGVLQPIAHRGGARWTRPAVAMATTAPGRRVRAQSCGPTCTRRRFAPTSRLVGPPDCLSAPSAGLRPDAPEYAAT